MDANGRLDYRDIDTLDENGEDLECYACVLILDRDSLNPIRLLEPCKGIMKSYSYRKPLFHKEGKNGNFLKAGINYYGPIAQSADLHVSMDREEIYKIWSELKEKAFKLIEKKEKQVAQKKEDLKKFFENYNER